MTGVELTSGQIEQVSGGMMNPIRGMIHMYNVVKDAAKDVDWAGVVDGVRDKINSDADSRNF